jgi:cytochrome c-type biogenesis protein CcmH
MVLWILFALLTVLVAAALLYPLSRRGETLSPDKAGEVEVYRDQMKELERDQAQGLINAEEAEYARAEIGRRLIAAAGGLSKADGDDASERSGWRRFAIGTVTIVPPAVGLCLYIMLGSPGLPDQPLEARLENPGNDMSLLVAKVERHLAQNPNDGTGWDVLAPIYFRTMRLDDAELAYRNAMRIMGPNATRLSGLGETLVAANDGIVTEDARSAFEEAVRLEPGNARARFYVALSLEQSGRTAEAKATFEEIAKASPPDAPWMGLINEHIARNGGSTNGGPANDRPATTGPTPDAPSAPAAGSPPALGNPTADDMAAAQDLSPEDRQAMIRGMVDSLAARLEADPKNIEGWLRLVRSYMVLGERDKAEAALKSGLGQFPVTGGEGRQLAALARDMGLAVDAATPQAEPQAAPEGVTQ